MRGVSFGGAAGKYVRLGILSHIWFKYMERVRDYIIAFGYMFMSSFHLYPQYLRHTWTWMPGAIIIPRQYMVVGALLNRLVFASGLNSAGNAVCK